MSQISIEDKVAEALLTQEPAKVFSHFIRENDLLFLSEGFDNSREIIKQRTAIYDVILSKWFREVLKKSSYEGPIAFIAHGGYGRREMTPYSDVDLAFLGRNKNELKSFEEVLSSECEINGDIDPFKMKNGFSTHAAFYTLEDIGDHDRFNAPQVNSMCEARVLFDRQGFASEFNDELMKNRKVFSHLDYLVNEWKKITGETKYGLDNLNSFNIKEDMGGLRHLQLGLRIPRIGSAESLSSLYDDLLKEDPEVMQAYDFLLKLRGFVHLRRKLVFEEARFREGEVRKAQGKNVSVLETLTENEIRDADTLNYKDYTAMGENFGSYSQKNLIESRRIIANYADLEISKILKKGFSHNGFTYGSQGIFICDSKEKFDEFDSETKNEKLFGLLKIVQTQSLPVDFVEYLDRFSDSSEWISFSKGFADLFYTEGDFPKTLELLNRIGAYNSLIPGAKELEISVPKGGHKGQYLTSTAFGRQKVTDHFTKEKEGKISSLPSNRFNFSQTLSQISLEERAGILLTYQTARIPQILGISSEEYYQFIQKEFNCAFSNKTIETASFLTKERDTLLNAAKNRINNYSTVEQIANNLLNVNNLKVLRTYTEIDLLRKKENNHLWPIIDELYFKVLDFLNNQNGNLVKVAPKVFRTSYPDEQIEVLDELGSEIRDGIYGELALKWLPKFVKVKKSLSPHIELSRTFDGDELHVCSMDSPGLLKLISGRCYESGLDISQVHAYTLPKSNLIFDIFHIEELPNGFSASSWNNLLSRTISGEEELKVKPREILAGVDFDWNIEYCKDDGELIQLNFDTIKHKKGYLFALTSGLYSHLSANIYAAKSFRDRGDSFRVFFKSPIRNISQMRNKLGSYFEGS